MPGLARLRRLSGRDAVLLGQAVAAILRVRFYLLGRRHHALRRMIESLPVPHGRAVPNGDLAAVAWSVRNAARLVPGATCLTQASAGQLLLAQRGYATTVRLSVPVRGGAGKGLAPHAWLMAGDTIVLGGTPAEYDQHRALHDFDMPGIEAWP